MTAYIKRGFTLIELLIVMAILGVLAVIVLVAINPVEQLARARDTGRISAVQQLGRAAVAFYTSQQVYPDPASNFSDPACGWDCALTHSQDISTFPTAVSATDPQCATNTINGYCYDVTGTGDQAIIFSLLVSQLQVSKCPTGESPYSVFNTFDSKGGIVCQGAGTEPTAGSSYTYY